MCSAAAAPEAQPVAAVSKEYRANPGPNLKLKLIDIATQHSKDQSGALANFSLGITAFSQKNYAETIQYLQTSQPLLPRLADYTAFYTASTLFELGDFPGVIQALAPVSHASSPAASPLAAKITLLEAQAFIRTRMFSNAISSLRANFEKLPQPDGDFALAQAYEGQSQLAQAAVLYQRVYYLRPATKLAVDASAAMDRLKMSMAKEYPPPMPQQVLARADTWLATKQYDKAKKEFHDMQAVLGGVEREQAMVRVGAAELASGNAAAALKYLKELHLARSEADAERNYHLAEAARKIGTQEAEVQGALQELAKHYAKSQWRLKALVSAGNSYLSARQPDKYTPLFRTAFEAFPEDATTAYSHWRITWDAYLASSPGARDLLREQLKNYPEDQRSASALYFLGRLAEGSQDYSASRAYYERLQQTYPHYYYGTLAADRLKDEQMTAVTPSAEVLQWLGTVAFPITPDFKLQAPSSATRAHIERAALLTAGGFSDWAATELRFGASNDGQRHILAIELARSDATVAIGLRHMKALAPEYLNLEYEQAPRELWGYLFPLPYQEPLLKNAKEQNLDPYLVAGLIRQESEFNPQAVSRVHALGLTQLMPATGSMLARQAGMAGFNVGMLLDPLVSLKLGMSYLKAQLDRWNGNLEQTLAAYNAGPGRVQQWTTGVTFREPAEFVESIPFNETREYVQSVIRNAAIYRQLYTSKVPPPQPGNALISTHADAPSASLKAASAAGRSVKSTVKRKRSRAVPQRAD